MHRSSDTIARPVPAGGYGGMPDQGGMAALVPSKTNSETSVTIRIAIGLHPLGETAKCEQFPGRGTVVAVSPEGCGPVEAVQSLSAAGNAGNAANLENARGTALPG